MGFFFFGGEVCWVFFVCWFFVVVVLGFLVFCLFLCCCFLGDLFVLNWCVSS